MRAHDNPFRSEVLADLPFVPMGVDPNALLDRLLAAGSARALVGPPGSGKTTLLRALANAAQVRGHRVRHVTLRRRGLVVAGDLGPLFECPVAADELVLVDSAGCLSWPSLWHAARACRGAAASLFTTHLPSGLVPAARTRATAELLDSLLDRILGAQVGDRAHARRLLRRHCGNLHTVFGALYTMYSGEA